tara:strand:- start:297 stop:521 length:225 start_codon:yes stop_codon:yes gene_type:complete
MPQVGDKHYPYTKAGYKAAAKAKVVNKDYRAGGLFSKSKMSKNFLDKHFPKRKNKARKTARDVTTSRLLKEMDY